MELKAMRHWQAGLLVIFSQKLLSHRVSRTKGEVGGKNLLPTKYMQMPSIQSGVIFLGNQCGALYEK